MSLILGILGLTLSASAANQSLTYQGRILKADGSALEAAAVTFQFVVMDPSSNCILYSETKTISMAGSKGQVSIPIGSGTRTDGGAHTWKQVFTNAGTLSSLTCTAGTTYTPTSSDERVLRVAFNDGSGSQSLASMAIRSAPFAMQADQVSGYGSLNLAKISGAGSANIFTPFQHDFLFDLSNAASASSAPCLTGEILKYNGTTWACAADATGGAPGDASYAAKGTVQFNTDAATSGVSVAAGVATINTGIAANQIPKLDASANLGVGIAPTSRFDVNGAITQRGMAAPAVSAAGTGRLYFDSTANHFYYSENGGAYAQLGAAASGALTSVTSISNAAGDITMAPAAGTGAVLVNSGTASVGSASGALVVTGGIGASGSIYTGGSINAGTTMTAATSIYSPQLYGASTAAGDIKIDGTSHATKGNVLLASAGGKVGIGTAVPNGILDVDGGTIASGAGNSILLVAQSSTAGASGNVTVTAGSTTTGTAGDINISAGTSSQWAKNGKISLKGQALVYGDWAGVSGTGYNQIALGDHAYVGGYDSVVIASGNGPGPNPSAYGDNSMVLGVAITGDNSAGSVGANSLAIGLAVPAGAFYPTVTGNNSVGFFLKDTTGQSVISGNGSMGILLGGQSASPVTISANNIMSIMGGNVGIATTSPTERLDITGTARVGSGPAVLTSLTSNIDAVQTTFTVPSTAGYPAVGTFAIESELITYTGITGTTFTGLTRGAYGTTAGAHISGQAINLALFHSESSTTSKPSMIAYSDGSVAIGTAIQTNSQVGWPSVAIGAGSMARDINSVAIGGGTADGTSAGAWGNWAQALGNYTFAIGQHVTASAYAQMVVGQYNTVSGTETANSWVATDPIFTVGNGTAWNATSTAMNILKNGNVGIGTASPTTALDVNGAITQRGMAAPAVSAAGQGKIYFDSTENRFKVSQDGGAYADLVGGGGGGGGLSSITAATGVGSIDNTNYAQTWAWSTATTQNPMTLTANALTTGSILNITTSSASLNSTSGLLNVANTGASTNGMVARIQSNSTAGSGLTVLANGNVGIGTAAPSDILTIQNDYVSTGKEPRISIVETSNDSAHGGELLFSRSSPSAGRSAGRINFYDAGIIEGLYGAGADGYLAFSTNAPGATGIVERMRVDSSGNVGIGTTAPSAKLEVTGSANATAIKSSGYSLTGANAQPMIDISGTWNTTGTPTLIKANVTDTASGGTPALIDLQVGGTTQFWVNKYGNVYGQSLTSWNDVNAAGNVMAQSGTFATSAATNMSFKPNNGLGTTAMTLLNSNNNVGIGTTSPQAKLDVNGAIDIKGLNGINYPATDSTAGGSIAIGANALQHQSALASAAYMNTAVGYNAISGGGLTAAAIRNTALGSDTLSGLTSGTQNTAVGAAVLGNISTGSYNTVVGDGSGYYLAGNSSHNTAVGYEALGQPATTSHNTAIGDAAMYYVNGLGENVSVGSQAGYGIPGVTTANKSVFVGRSAGLSITTGNLNTTLGYQAGYDLTTGGNNTILGQYPTTGVGVTTGSNNILIGQDVRPQSQTASNQLNIGNLIYATGLSSGATLSTGNVGIGTTSPWSLLHVGSGNGSIINPSVGTQLLVSSPGTTGMMVRDSSNNLEGAFTAWGGHIEMGSSTNHDFVLLSNDTARVTIAADGNVGIGAASTGSKLEVSGSIRAVAGSISSNYSSIANLTVDFSTANVISTSASCGAVTLSGMQDGGSYTLIVTGTSSGLCTFTHAGVSWPTGYKFSPANAVTDTSSSGETVYTFLKAGTKIYVSWITGMR